MSKAFGLAQLGNVYDDGALSNRNLIINGAMQVAQRGTSATGITTTSGYYTLDRFDYYVQSTGSLEYTMSQSSDAPEGFANSLKMECTTSQTLLTNANVYIRQKIEAQNLQHLGFGNSWAKPFTVSFWVKSSKTGLFTLSLYRGDSVRTTGLSYQVNAANTWEYKTLSFDPDTSGAVTNDNGNGMQLAFFIGSGPDLQSGTFTNGTWKAYAESEYAVNGQVSIATSGDTFQITGVQLEVGDGPATPFEHRSYSDELARCQRYYQEILNGSKAFGLAVNYRSTQIHFIIDLPVVMRAQPSATITSGSNYYVYYVNSGSRYFNNFAYETGSSSDRRVEFYDSASPSGTAGQSGMVRGFNANARVVLDAEL